MKQRNSYVMTERAVKRFKKWLVDEEITQSEFARRCNVSRQYINQVLKGQSYITQRCREIFLKGGYEIL